MNLACLAVFEGMAVLPRGEVPPLPGGGTCRLSCLRRVRQLRLIVQVFRASRVLGWPVWVALTAPGARLGAAVVGLGSAVIVAVLGLARVAVVLRQFLRALVPVAVAGHGVPPPSLCAYLSRGCVP